MKSKEKFQFNSNWAVGKKNIFSVKKILSFGVILGDEEILLPKKYVPLNCKLGDSIEVFIYTDSQDRIIATTLNPYGFLGDIVVLEVVDYSEFGAFLNFGIEKDLFMPCKPNQRFKKGQKVAVQITLDKEGRLLASQTLKFKKYFGNPYVKFQATPFRKTPLGFECIVDKQYQGMIFENEIFENIVLGNLYDVQIKKTRKDGKLDLKLIKDEIKHFLEVLQNYGGRIAISKKSDAKEIETIFQMSKKSFKRVLSHLVQEVGQDENGLFRK